MTKKPLLETLLDIKEHFPSARLEPDSIDEVITKFRRDLHEVRTNGSASAKRSAKAWGGDHYWFEEGQEMISLFNDDHPKQPMLDFTK